MLTVERPGSVETGACATEPGVNSAVWTGTAETDTLAGVSAAPWTAPAETDAPTAPAAPDAAPFAWERRVGFLTNRDTWFDLAKVVVVTIVLATGLFTVIGAFSDGDVIGMLGILPLIFGIFLVLILVGTVVTAALYGGAYTMEYMVDATGIRWTTSRRSGRAARAVLRGARLIGDLTLNPRLSGSARLAEASESGSIRWKDVRRATPNAGRHVVAVRNGWRTVVRLYCDPGDWDRVNARIAAGMTSALRGRPYR